MRLFRTIQLISLVISSFRKLESEELGKRLGKLHGLPQKIGQHLTLYPINQWDTFQQLYFKGKAESIPINSLLKKKEIPVIAQPVLVAQASIGQVFKVSMSSGDIAVKVKYSNIEKHIKSDFRLLQIFVKIIKLFPFVNNNIESLINIIREKIIEECDYVQENSIQNELHLQFKNFEYIYIPRVFEYSDDNMLVSEWIDGTHLHNYFNDSDIENKLEIFNLFFVFQIKSLLEYHIVHADPHPGNFLVREKDKRMQLVILDFGCSIRMTDNEGQALFRLMLGEYSQFFQIKEDLIQLGFAKKTLEVYNPILSDILSIILEPFYSPINYDFQQWRMQYKLNTLMASKVWDEPFVLPAKMVYLVRMFQGLYYYARKYKIKYNWHQGLREVVQGGSYTNE